MVLSVDGRWGPPLATLAVGEEAVAAQGLAGGAAEPEDAWLSSKPPGTRRYARRRPPAGSRPEPRRTSPWGTGQAFPPPPSVRSGGALATSPATLSNVAEPWATIS